MGLEVKATGKLKPNAEKTVNLKVPLEMEGDFKQKFVLTYATVEKSTVSGTGTETITGLIPAGALVLGLTARVTEAITGTLTSWSLGITGHTDHYGLTLAKTLGTTVGPANYKVADIPGPHYAAAATDVLLTGAAGNFSTGKVRITVHYIMITAATS